MQQITNPYFQYWDNNGNFLAGGKVYVYESLTDTEATVYTDSDKSVAHPNPVVLNARGEALIYGDGPYKFVIKDASETTISTVDPIVITATENGRIYLSPSGSDDYQAIQDAIDEMGAAGGGEVILLPGIYNVSEEIQLGDGVSEASPATYGGVTLRSLAPGAYPYTGWPGQAPTKINATHNDEFVIRVNGPMAGWGIKGFELSSSGTCGGGIAVVAGLAGHVEDILFMGFSSNALVLSTYAGTQSTQHNSFKNLLFYYDTTPGSVGIFLTHGGANADICMCSFENLEFYFQAAQTGIHLGGCDFNHFSNVQFWQVTPAGAGLGLYFNYDNYSSGVWPSNNMFWGFDCGNLTFPGIGGTVVANNSSPAATASPNVIYGWNMGNGNQPVNLANLTIKSNVSDRATVYLDSAQSVETAEVVAFDTSSYDTGSLFAPLTNSFVPRVSGYYRVYTQVGFDANAGSTAVVAIMVNTTPAATQIATGMNSNANVVIISASTTVWLNGDQTTEPYAVYVTAATSGGGPTDLITGFSVTYMEIEGPL